MNGLIYLKHSPATTHDSDIEPSVEERSVKELGVYWLIVEKPSMRADDCTRMEVLHHLLQVGIIPIIPQNKGKNPFVSQ